MLSPVRIFILKLLDGAFNCHLLFRSGTGTMQWFEDNQVLTSLPSENPSSGDSFSIGNIFLQ